MRTRKMMIAGLQQRPSLPVPPKSMDRSVIRTDQATTAATAKNHDPHPYHNPDPDSKLDDTDTRSSDDFHNNNNGTGSNNHQDNQYQNNQDTTGTTTNTTSTSSMAPWDDVEKVPLLPVPPLTTAPFLTLSSATAASPPPDIIVTSTTTAVSPQLLSTYGVTSKSYYHTLQLLFGICGIYISFLYYGNLQEDIFRYTSDTNTNGTTTGTSSTGTKFTQAWLLQAAESFINGWVGYIGILLCGSGFVVTTSMDRNTPKIDGTRHSPNDNATSTDSITDSNSNSSRGTQTSLQSSPTSVAILPTHQNHHHHPSSFQSAATTTTDSTACKKASSFPLVSFVWSKLGRPPLQAPKSSLSQKQLYHNSGNTNGSSLPSNQHCYKVPHVNFCISGMAQVSAKACTSIALSYGLSYPIATLTKSGKMAPVMIGSIYYGNATYTVRDYIQVALIIFGTAMVSFGSSSHHGSTSSGQKRDSMLGVLYILMSLLFDGVTAGYQKRFQHDMSMMNVQPKSYDYMYYTNIYMFGTALTIALLCNEIPTGMTFLFNNPVLFYQIIQFTICSAIGQSFIFYTLANFDPLVLSTVTTTRKIFSVLLSIFLKGHSLSYMGWTGISIACSGILSEMHHKMGKKKHTS